MAKKLKLSTNPASNTRTKARNPKFSVLSHRHGTIIPNQVQSTTRRVKIDPGANKREKQLIDKILKTPGIKEASQKILIIILSMYGYDAAKESLDRLIKFNKTGRYD